MSQMKSVNAKKGNIINIVQGSKILKIMIIFKIKKKPYFGVTFALRECFLKTPAV